MDIPNATRRVDDGITLVEVLVTIALAGILLAGAFPSMHTMWLDNRLTTLVNQFVSSLHGARRSAVTRREYSVICPSSDGKTCIDTTDWQSGWIHFMDSNASRQRDDDEEVLRIDPPLPEDMHIFSDPSRRQIRFQIDGRSAGSNNTLVFCDARGPEAARAVILSNTGRPRIATSLSGNLAGRCPSN